MNAGVVNNVGRSSGVGHVMEVLDARLGRNFIKSKTFELEGAIGWSYVL